MTTVHCLPWQWFHALFHINPSSLGAEHNTQTLGIKGLDWHKQGAARFAPHWHHVDGHYSGFSFMFNEEKCLLNYKWKETTWTIKDAVFSLQSAPFPRRLPGWVGCSSRGWPGENLPTLQSHTCTHIRGHTRTYTLLWICLISKNRSLWRSLWHEGSTTEKPSITMCVYWDAASGNGSLEVQP